MNKCRLDEQDREDAPVKPKKVRTAPTNTSLLPPCKVCHEPAAGFHYGANTCEACKGFFRRTLVRGGEYECINGDSKCSVVQQGESRKKRICPRCRHMKCLAVGMSTDAIKTGRYTHAKRTQDVLEYKKAYGGTGSKGGDQPSSPAATVSATTTATTALGNTTTTATVHPSAVASVGSSSSTLDIADTLLALSSSSMPVPTVEVENLPALVSSSPLASADCDQNTKYASQISFPMEASSPVGLLFNSVECVTSGIYSEHESLKTNKDDLHNSFCSPSQQTSSTSRLLGGVFDQSFGGEFSRNDESTSLGSKDLCSPGQLSCVSSPESVMSVSVEKVSDLLTDEECRKIVQHILQSYENVGISRCMLSPEEILQKQKLCHEKCQAHMEAFGSLGYVSIEEYQEVYETTGIDVDNRQAFISVLSKTMDMQIRKYVAFLKTLPGFSDLTMADQIRLIKDNRCACSLLNQTAGYNHELKVMTMPSGRTFCEHDLHKICGPERTKRRHQVLHTIQKLGLTREERIICGCMFLFSAGNDDVDEPEKVSVIQWKMAQCLRWLLQENKRPKHDLFFARIISTYLLLREFGKQMHDFLKCRPFFHYAQFRNNELLAEFFSSS